MCVCVCVEERADMGVRFVMLLLIVWKDRKDDNYRELRELEKYYIIPLEIQRDAEFNYVVDQ